MKVLLEARLPHSSISLLLPVHIFGKLIVYFQYHKNREVLKNGIFAVWMTVRIDPAPFGQLSVIFFVRLALDYDYMCLDTDFTQQKGHFIITRIPNSEAQRA